MCGYCEKDRKAIMEFLYPKPNKKMNPSKIFNGVKNTIKKTNNKKKKKMKKKVNKKAY
tara:strand:+ start:66 stop:239 length:174 start_codon:yes stop_codon:yes gene_type:complete